MSVNPFSLPGRQRPWDPLDPLSGDSSEVLNQYVAVDNTEEAFSQFSDAFPGSDELARRGQLIVAMGIDGGGKSSVLNRCAFEAKDRIERAGVQAALVDARGQAKVTDPRETRIGQVADFVSFVLTRAGLVSEDDELPPNPSELYSRLAYYLPGKAIVLVRLPRTELIEEIDDYAQFSHPRLVFFAELGGAYGEEAVRRKVEDLGQSRAIILQVGALGAGHGKAFVEKRFEINRHANVNPELQPEVVERLISSRGPSIRELQRFLYFMYEMLYRSPDATPPVITWEYALEAYYRVGDEL